MKNIETQFYTFAESKEDRFELQNGTLFGPVTVAYETYGELSPEKDNVILLFHALSGSQHAAGHNPEVPGVGDLWVEECQTGWWDDFVGPGKALNTNEFFVICANYFGGCYGSTGPSSIDPETGKPYGGSFPHIGANDIVDTQVKLLKHLGIDKLHAVVGSSLGGMLALNLAVRHPDRVNIVIPIAAGIGVTTLQRIHNFEQIFAIESDSNFKAGHYYDGPRPVDGLALARMISHKTFVSLWSLDNRASSEVVDASSTFKSYELHHPIESYLLHQSQKFVKRFDANTYLLIMDIWQRFNLVADAAVADIKEAFQRCRNQHFLIFSIDSDVCFYPEEQQTLARLLQKAGVDNQRITVHSDKGHDTFLLEPKLFTPHIDYALRGN